MEITVVTVVEKIVEFESPAAPGAECDLRIRMLGPLAVSAGGRALSLPASRKARALLAYLALAPAGVSRSHLCELLWDVPSDPRGELRWCLSKIRGVVGAPRIPASGDTVRLDVACVDAREAARGAETGRRHQGPQELRHLCGLFAGDFLEGLELERCPAFTGWLLAQRRRFRAAHATLLERLADALPDGEALAPLEAWMRLAPFDLRAHERFLATLARLGWIREGDDHLAATARTFAAEGLDAAPLRDGWRLARTQQAGAALVARWAGARAA